MWDKVGQGGTKVGHCSVRIEDEKEEAIKRIARKEDRSFSYIVNLAIDEYLEKIRRVKNGGTIITR